MIKKTLNEGKYQYEALVNEKSFGKISYSAAKKRLKFQNSDVSLVRKILLLGYSTKVGKEHLVGQVCFFFENTKLIESSGCSLEKD